MTSSRRNVSFTAGTVTGFLAGAFFAALLWRHRFARDLTACTLCRHAEILASRGELLRRINHMGGLPGSLGPIHRGIGVVQNLLGGLVDEPGNGNSHAGGDTRQFTADVDWRSDISSDSFRDAAHLGLAAALIEEKREFVAPEAGNHILRPDGAA